MTYTSFVFAWHGAQKNTLNPSKNEQARAQHTFSAQRQVKVTHQKFIFRIKQNVNKQLEIYKFFWFFWIISLKHHDVTI